MKHISLVLGSQSPRRQQLFRELGWPYELRLADIKESLVKGNLAINTENLAKKKAQAIEVQENECLVTADTLVGLEGKILGKPTDLEAASDMLLSLSNRWHEVVTGVCITYKGKLISFHEKTEVFIKEIADIDLQYYIGQHNPMDKAGAYGIQDWFGLTHVGAIKGCYYNVMGFPMPRFYEELTKILK